MKKSKIKIAIIIVILIIIITTVVLILNKLLNKNKNKWERREIYVDADSVTSQAGESMLWGEMENYQKFTILNYNDVDYSSAMTEITKDKVHSFLEKTNIKGIEFPDNTEHTINANVYKIDDISAECALAVQFEGGNNYYIFVNAYYKPSTLGQFIQDLDLQNTITFGTIQYLYDNPENPGGYVEFENVDNETIWKMLFDNPLAECIDTKSYDSIEKSLSMSMNMKTILSEYDRFSFSVNTAGYLSTNLLETEKAFYIGKEKAQEFFDYIIDNYKGYEIVYVYDSQEDEDTDLAENEVIMMYDKETNTTSVVTDIPGVNGKVNSTSETASNNLPPLQAEE